MGLDNNNKTVEKKNAKSVDIMNKNWLENRSAIKFEPPHECSQSIATGQLR